MNNNEPAFPQDRDEQGRIPQGWGVGGITVRDYFAAKAMASTDLSMTQMMCTDRGKAPADWNKYVAKQAYEMADAMMEARL